jgi:hypothetical protein
MPSTINASTSNGLVQSADGSGIIKLQSNGVTTNALAWVNFNGTGTVAIRSSYNVSSITDNGTGQYTVNLIAALSDANYATFVNVFPETSGVGGTGAGSIRGTSTKTTTAIGFGLTAFNDTVLADFQEIDVIIFGN